LLLPHQHLVDSLETTRLPRRRLRLHAFRAGIVKRVRSLNASCCGFSNSATMDRIESEGMIAVWPHKKWIAASHLPYLTWVSIATFLQLSITALSRTRV
jgi:hypothetical protein